LKASTKHCRTHGSFLDMTHRSNCYCLQCRMSSAFAHGVAIFCNGWLETLCRQECCHQDTATTVFDLLEPYTKQFEHNHRAQVAEAVCDYIDPHVFLHQQFDLDSFIHWSHLHYSKAIYPTADTTLPKTLSMPSYLYYFFHLCDQYIDVSPSVWIHFMWMLKHIETKGTFPICSHTFIPLIWCTLLTALKVDDDHSVNNRLFCTVINFTILHKSNGTRHRMLTFYDHQYRNPILQSAVENKPTNESKEHEQYLLSVPLLILPHLNALEEVFMTKVINFTFRVHAIDTLPLVHCVCQQCQPFHSIYEVIYEYFGHFLPSAKESCTFEHCGSIQSSYEYIQFTRYIYEWLQQTCDLPVLLSSPTTVSNKRPMTTNSPVEGSPSKRRRLIVQPMEITCGV
jgi:hypothetical protein